MKLRTLFLFLIIFFAVFSAYEYLSNREESTAKIPPTSEGYFRAFAYNNSTDNRLVLRANSSTERPYLEFGNVSRSTGVVYTAALALSNEMKSEIVITGVDVEDTQWSLSQYMQIYLHNNSDSLAENDNGLLIYDRGTVYRFNWTLAAGDSDASTAGTNSLSYSNTDNIYYSPNPLNAANNDFVWVEIRIVGGNVVPPNQDYSGYITFYYKYGAIKLWYHADIV